jgi:hypothetical protein
MTAKQDAPMVSTEVITIGPEEAQLLLKGNRNNRPLNSRTVNIYAQAMARGEWKLNGEPIQIASTGRLMNGQHRLTAVIKSGANICVVVVRGVDEAVFNTLDRGRTRTAGEVLGMRGEKHYNGLAHALKLYFLWEQRGNPFFGGPEAQPTIPQLEHVLDSVPRIRDHVEWATKSRWCRINLSVGLTGFSRMAFVGDGSEETIAHSFFEDLETGAGLQAGSPALILRDRVTSDRASKTKMPSWYKGALLFKAFRLYRDGALIKYLRVRTEGDAVEKDLFVI